MSKQFQEPAHSFNAYYEDVSLIVQFILEEFIQTDELISALKEKLSNSQWNSDSDCSFFFDIFSELVGSLTPQQRFSFPRCMKGSLTKLKEYCDQLSRSSHQLDKYAVNLYLAVHQTWLIALQILELLNGLRLSNAKNAQIMELKNSLQRLAKTLQMRYDQVIRCLPQIFLHHWDNENVILFLLRKKKQLSKLYGEEFLHKRFKCPFAQNQLMSVVIQRYQLRGFSVLPPKILNLLMSEELA